jgi:hypothetical protein
MPAGEGRVRTPVELVLVILMKRKINKCKQSHLDDHIHEKFVIVRTASKSWIAAFIIVSMKTATSSYAGPHNDSDEVMSTESSGPAAARPDTSLTSLTKKFVDMVRFVLGNHAQTDEGVMLSRDLP